MQYATRNIFYVFAAILFFYGVADLAAQLKAGDELQWRVPIILLGIGSGIPIVFFSFPDFLVSDLSGESSDSSNYDGDSYGDGGDSGSD